MEKITQDGFVWKIVERHQAIDMLSQGKELYALYDDESEALIETLVDLYNALNNENIQIGYEKRNE
jgi:hypothetical protein